MYCSSKFILLHLVFIACQCHPFSEDGHFIAKK